MLSDSYLYTRSVLSNSGKRQVLWNVVQPGDPYDIKRSMIAKLPGDKKLFMGNHLQLICLLQAAQIERLSQFLEDHKLKFRQIERNFLDRHSYEIQIKELTQQINSYQNQNAKLKDFIKLQGESIQDLNNKNRNKSNNNANSNYISEENNLRVQELLKENAILLQFNQEYRLHQQNLLARLQALQKAKNKQIQDLRMNHTQFSQSSIENTLNIYKFQSEGEIHRLQFQLKKIRDLCNQKDNEILNITKANQSYINELSLYKNKGQANKLSQQKIQDFEKRLKFATTEIDRKTIALAEANNKYEQSLRKKEQLEQNSNRFNFQMRQKMIVSDNQILRLREIIQMLQKQRKGTNNNYNNQTNSQFYQVKIKQLIKENEVLKAKLVSQGINTQSYKQQLQKVSFENSKYKLVEKENIKMKESLLQKEVLKRKLIQLQNNFRNACQQIERLSKQNQVKDNDQQKYRLLGYQYEKLKIKLKQTELNLTNRFESQIAWAKIDYQQKIEYLNRTQGSQFQSKIQYNQKEIQSLRQLLKNKTDEAQRYRGKIYQLQSYIKKIEVQSYNKISSLQNNFALLRQENDKLYLDSRKLQSIQRQYQKLLNTIKLRQEQLYSVKNSLRESQVGLRQYQLEINRRISTYQQNIGAIKLQNAQLKKKISQFINESNNKLYESNRQINTLNINYKNTNEQRNLLEIKLKQLSQDFDKNKNILQGVIRQNEQLRRKLQQGEVKHINFFNQATFNHKIIAQQNENLKKQLNDNKASTSQYEKQVSKTITTNEQNIGMLGKQNEVLKRKLKQVEIQLNNYKQQIAVIQNSHINLSSEYDKLRKYQQEYELSVKSKFQGEVNTKYTNYQQAILFLRNEIQNYKRRQAESEAKILQQSQQAQKMDLSLRNHLIQHQNLKKQLVSKDGIISHLEVDHHNKIANYQSSLQNMMRVYQELKVNFNNNIASFNKKNQEHRQLDEKYRQLTMQLQDSQRKYNNLQLNFKKTMEGDVNKKYSHLEQIIQKTQSQRNAAINQLSFINKQKQTLLINFNQKTLENQSLRKKIYKYQTSITDKEAQANKRSGLYEQNISMLMKERQQMLSKFQQQKSELNGKYLAGQSKIRSLMRQIERISSTPSVKPSEDVSKEDEQLTLYKKKAGQQQQQLILTSKQIERLKSLLQAKEELLHKAEGRILEQDNEAQSFRIKFNELEARFTQTYQQQVVRRYNEYQQIINDLQQHIHHLQNINAQLVPENQQCHLVIQSKAQQLEQTESAYRNINSQINQLTKAISILHQQNESLKNTPNIGYLEQSQSLKTIISESSIKLKIFQSQNQRLNQVLAAKNNQLLICNKRINDLLQAERLSKQNYQQQLKILRIENESYQSKLLQPNGISGSKTDLQDRLLMLSQQNEQVNTFLRENQEQINRLQYRNHSLIAQIQQLKREGSKKCQHQGKVLQYEQKITQIVQQNEYLLQDKDQHILRLQSRINQAMNQKKQLQRQLEDVEFILTEKYQADLLHTVSKYQQNIVDLSKGREDFFKSVGEYQSQIAFLNQEIERLNQINKNKNQQLQRSLEEIQHLRKYSQTKIGQGERNNWQSNKLISNQYENSRKHIQQYERTLKKLYQQYERFQTNINDLKRQKQSLVDKNHALSEEINRLRGENTDLEIQVKDVRLRLSDQSSLQKRISEHMALIVILFAEIESLRKRIGNQQKQVEDERRRSLSPNIV